MSADKLTTAQRSATAKAAAAQRQADKDLGIPSITALAAEILDENLGASKASARREAVRRIEFLRENEGRTPKRIQIELVYEQMYIVEGCLNVLSRRHPDKVRLHADLADLRQQLQATEARAEWH